MIMLGLYYTSKGGGVSIRKYDSFGSEIYDVITEFEHCVPRTV